MSDRGFKLPHALRLHVPLPGIDGIPRLALASAERALSATHMMKVAATIHDTLGWDTVFAVPASKVNESFAKPGLYPLDYAGSQSGALYTVSVAGNFGPWSIDVGGSGSIINLSIPIASGSLTGAAQPISLANGRLCVEVKMNYLPQPSQGKGGVPNELLLSTKPMNPSGNIAQVTSLEVPGLSDATLISAAKDAFQNFFNGHLGRITYIFNTVNLNAIADKDAFQWLQPTYTTYAYYDAPSIDKAVFGVLCMVLNNDPGTNTNEIGPGSIPDGAQAGFSISGQTFMKQMVLPVMANAFNASNGTTIDSSYFVIVNSDTEIDNAKTIPMRDVTYGAIDYHPECLVFTATLQANQIVVYTKVHVEISPGIDAYLESTNYMGLRLEESGGEQYLNFYEVSPARTEHWVDVAEGIIITEIILAIIGAVVGVIVGAVYQSAKAIIIGIIIAVVFGIVAAIPELIAQITSEGVIGNLPSIASLVTAATNNVKWTGGQEFKIKLAKLNGSMQLGGWAFEG